MFALSVKCWKEYHDFHLTSAAVNPYQYHKNSIYTTIIKTTDYNRFARLLLLRAFEVDSSADENRDFELSGKNSTSEPKRQSDRGGGSFEQGKR